MRQKQKIFISYNRQDLSRCQALAKALSQSGFDVWFDQNSLPGDTWVSNVTREIQACDIFILLLTPDALKSHWVKEEYELALITERRIVAAIYEHTEVSGFLLNRQWTSVVGLADVDAAERVTSELLRLVHSSTLPAPQPLPAPVVAPTGLPRPSRFIGRENELLQVMSLLRAGTPTGVSTLEGEAGVGKTAVAAEAVAQLSTDTVAFPGGGMWISCEGLAGDEGLLAVWRRVADSLTLPPYDTPYDSRSTLQETVVQALLGRRRTLIALDNVERDLDIAALVDLLALPTHTVLLITTRYPVSSSRVSVLSLGPVTPQDAEQLFCDQLHRADPARPTSDELGYIRELIPTLSGNPLLIKLTAAHIGNLHLSFDQVPNLLDSSTSADAKSVTYQTFLRSWKVLTEAQQHLFAGLSLWHGSSFRQDAAIALAQSQYFTKNIGSAQADVATLASYALIETVASAPPRLRFHPTMRAFAEQHLEDIRRVAPTRARALGDGYMRHVEEFVAKHSQCEEWAKLDAEGANLLGALEWAFRNERYHDVLKLVVAMHNAWEANSRYDDLQMMLSWGVAAAKRVENLEVECQLAIWSATLKAKQHNPPAAMAGFRRALDLARQLGNQAYEFEALHGLAMEHVSLREWGPARERFTSALHIGTLPGSRQDYERAALHGLGLVDWEEGYTDSARERWEEALELAQRQEPPSRHAMAVEKRWLGRLHLKQGDIEVAKGLLEDSIRDSIATHDSYGTAKAHESLAELLARTGHTTAAIQEYQAAADLLERLGSAESSAVRRSIERLKTNS